MQGGVVGVVLGQVFAELPHNLETRSLADLCLVNVFDAYAQFLRLLLVLFVPVLLANGLDFCGDSIFQGRQVFEETFMNVVLTFSLAEELLMLCEYVATMQALTGIFYKAIVYKGNELWTPTII